MVEKLENKFFVHVFENNKSQFFTDLWILILWKWLKHLRVQFLQNMQDRNKYIKMVHWDQKTIIKIYFLLENICGVLHRIYRCFKHSMREN